MKKDPDCASAVAVRRLLELTGMTQAECSRRSELREEEISKLVSGHLKGKGARVCVGLGRAFGMSAERIFRILSGELPPEPLTPANAKRGTKDANA